MDSIETWRGQIPAWQCDVDARWSARFLFGAFEDAGRIFSALAGISGGLPALESMPGGRPAAGSVAVIRSTWPDGSMSVSHEMVDAYSGRVLARAAMPVDGRATGTLVNPRPSRGSDGMLPAGLSLVANSECDIMGHMSVQYYAARLSDAEAAVAGHLGIDPAASFGPALRPLEHRMRFFAELAAGEAARSEASIWLGVRSELLLRTEMRSLATDKLAAAFESDLVCVDADTGAALTLPDIVARRLATLPFPAGDLSVWSPKGELGLEPESTERWIVLRREEVVPWETDHLGALPLRFLFARMSSSVPYLMGRMGLGRELMTERNLGRAAVGYRLRHHRHARAGDVLELRSSVGAVGEKSWRFRHAFVNVTDGAMVCIVESVIVLFSLSERRAVALPPDVRRQAEHFALSFDKPAPATP